MSTNTDLFFEAEDKHTQFFVDSFMFRILTQSDTRHSFTQTLPRVISGNFRSSVRNCLAQSSVKLHLILYLVVLEIVCSLACQSS